MRVGGISGVSGYGSISGMYPMYSAAAVTGVRGASAVTRGTDGMAQATVDGAKNASQTGRVQKGECQTCKNRKYVDGSNEGDVSFKTPGHIDPGRSAATVMSHEQEHVANAVSEGNKPNKDLVRVSVNLKTAVCPECGKVYVSGGTTNSTIRTTSEGTDKPNNNPYARNQANLNYLMSAGKNMDLSA